MKKIASWIYFHRQELNGILMLLVLFDLINVIFRSKFDWICMDVMVIALLSKENDYIREIDYLTNKTVELESLAKGLLDELKK
ncbi:hypothetical protein ABHC39_05255 [Pediococcus acidilactici]|uniref:hypothetical protein n=1 Tax=Pediococcus acidilactici TaxID=1254 RepID=UPI0023303554|nr:hypothetical protein [Pediococcus acidilactici]MDB8867660.1 hypothetical protein [Pediococcus acidilactici]